MGGVPVISWLSGGLIRLDPYGYHRFVAGIEEDINTCVRFVRFGLFRYIGVMFLSGAVIGYHR